jgi:formate dehydrogenase iron-sulfur subunit
MPITAFLTDSTLCIGCKACEVACKDWNRLPDDGITWRGLSYDHTGALGHSTWRHVKFVEGVELQKGLGTRDLGLSETSTDKVPSPQSLVPTWNFSSDVCKHCEHAGCLEACPTGSIVRTEFGGVFIQPDICNGCGYCVVSCPFGVVDRHPSDGRAFKCTFCYDRQKAGLIPACAKACPTESILFGEIDELRARAADRVEALHARGVEDAALYDARDTTVGGTHAMFIVRGDPRTYNLPPAPEAPGAHLQDGWRSAAIAAGAMVVLTAVAFLGQRAPLRPTDRFGRLADGSRIQAR